LFGNEAADTGGYQVPVRVAHALGLPCVTGIKRLDISGESGRIAAGREYAGVEETFELPLPAVVSVKEGINLPRYPSLPGRVRAKRAPIETIEVGAAPPEGLNKRRLTVPAASGSRAEVLGSGGGQVIPGFDQEMFRIHPHRIVSIGIESGENFGWSARSVP